MSYVIEPPVFADRVDAGRQLAERLIELPDREWAVVAISRDGLPVAVAVAAALGTQLDLQLVAPLPAPADPEHHFGAVALDGTLVFNEAVAARLGLSRRQVEEIVERARAAARRADLRLHGGRAHPSAEGRAVLLVDDGTSAGFALLAGVRSLRQQGVRRLVVALPVVAAATLEQVAPDVDDSVAVVIHESPHFVPTAYYRVWTPVEDAEAAALLRAV
ncbi:MAG: phosphoribosyltransferase [Chloroflexi bacterium]|nr:phosphoribosyltransferase [Chloroflexota bacterium]